jgi:hypothetical protein
MTDDQMCAMLTLLGWVPQMSLPAYLHKSVGWDIFNCGARAIVIGQMKRDAARRMRIAEWERAAYWFDPYPEKLCAWTDVPPALMRSFYEYLMWDGHD